MIHGIVVLMYSARPKQKLPFWITYVALSGGCQTVEVVPDLGELYNRSAQYHGPFRNPVILIPGIMGTKLKDSKTGKVVWGAFSGGYVDPKTPDGAPLAALPMKEGVPLRDLRNDVVTNGVLDRINVNVFGLPLELKAYAYILRALGIGGYKDETLGLSGAVDYGGQHFTCFQFDYDWRRDNVENAMLFHKFLLDKRAYVRAEIQKRFGVDNPKVKFDIVAHSMGGLIARYYLRYGPADLPADGSQPSITWAGKEFVDRVILVAPPNAGSVQALYFLVHGFDMGLFLPYYPPALLGTFPSVYQLLPRERHAAVVEVAEGKSYPKDPFNPELWTDMDWGLASPGQDDVLERLLPGVRDPATRRRIALEHQRKCLARARQFCAALDTPATPLQESGLYLFAGDGVSTEAVASVDRESGSFKIIKNLPGDGVVPRYSCLLDERVGGNWKFHLVSPIPFRQIIFLSSDHLGLTKNTEFVDNVLYLLLEDIR